MMLLAAITGAVGGFMASGAEGAVQFGTQAWLIVSVLHLTRDVAELQGRRGKR